MWKSLLKNNIFSGSQNILLFMYMNIVNFINGEDVNRRMLIIGLIISGVLGLLVLMFTDNPIFAIILGMLLAVLMQRLLK
jgi:hypothetical protein